MKPPVLFTALLSAICPACFAQNNFTGDVLAANNQNYTAGTNCASITSGNTPSLYLIRSVNSWSDTWWNFTMGTDNKLTLGFSSVPQMTFQNGAVGIGTTAPAATLHVNGSFRVRGGTWTSNGNDIFLNGGTTGQAIYLRPNGDGSGVGSANFTAWGVHTFYDANGHEQVRFNNGNVGIGTTNPAYPLSVNGTVRAKEVIVDTGWSDYVFAKDYKLAPLSEVEEHIKTEQHLPGIPSAKEVAGKGISVGEMQAKLLAKIEELTLHVIEQGKAIRMQQEEIRALRRELNNQ